MLDIEVEPFMLPAPSFSFRVPQGDKVGGDGLDDGALKVGKLLLGGGTWHGDGLNQAVDALARWGSWAQGGELLAHLNKEFKVM
jgi:hypothetical protein